MDLIEHLVWSLEDTRQRTLKLLGEVSQEEFGWRPCGTCNSIGSIAIHIGRVEDAVANNALGLGGLLWQTQGWNEKFGMPADDWGWAFDKQAPGSQATPQRVAEYLNVVRGRTLPALRALPPARLDEMTRGRQPRTVAQSLAFITVEELQHLGQMDYLKGMKRSMGA